jgi:hypothetical protein
VDCSVNGLKVFYLYKYIWHVQGLMWHGACIMPLALLWTEALNSTVLDISYFIIIHKWLPDMISNCGSSIN